jgi:O-antigen ligase
MMMNSAAAFALGLIGGGVLVLGKLPGRLNLLALLLMIFLIAAAPLYIIGRVQVSTPVTGWLNSTFSEQETRALEARMMRKPLLGWLPAVTGSAVEEIFLQKLGYPKERVESTFFRFKQEDKLMEKVMQRPWFGWGGESRPRIFNSKGDDVSTSDGYWIINLGNRGFVGLISMCLAVLVPVARFTWAYAPRQWSHPALAAPAVMAIVLVLSLIDDLSNAMIDPLFILASGALAGLTGARLPSSAPGTKVPVKKETDALQPWTPPPKQEESIAETMLPGVLRRRLAARRSRPKP